MFLFSDLILLIAQQEKGYLIFCQTTTTILRPFFRDHPGQPVPQENFWTLWCNGRLTEADTATIRLGASPSRLTSAHLHHPPMFFYRQDALPAAQPTVSNTLLYYHQRFFWGGDGAPTQPSVTPEIWAAWSVGWLNMKFIVHILPLARNCFIYKLKLQYKDDIGNTVEDSFSIFALIWMHKLPSSEAMQAVKLCSNKNPPV